MKNKIAIIGGGDLAKQIDHYISNFDSSAEVVGFVDDTVNVGDCRFNKPCLGPIAELRNLFEAGAFDQVILGIGYKHVNFRKKLFSELKDLSFYTFIHPAAIIDPSARVGKGVVIATASVIEQRSVIGDNVFVYNNVSIAHDSKVLSHSFLSPRVAIAGFSTVGECCNIGINTTIIDNISICDQVQTGGGTVVIKNIETPGLYVGNPAKFIR
jgi:sugar O-acyltransferase (sialic acid O-acetyltransferase NeuD family)